MDEKIIIRSEELKKKRKSAAAKSSAPAGKASSQGKKPVKKSSASSKAKAVPNESTSTDDSFRYVKGLDKYRKMGILPTKKDGPSDFRKKSANWRYDDVQKAAITDEDIDRQEEGEFGEKVRNMSATSVLAYAMAAVLLITSVMTTTVYADYRGEQNKALAMANLPYYVDDPSSCVAYNEDFFEETDYEMEDAASEMPSSEGKMLSFRNDAKSENYKAICDFMKDYRN